VTSKERGSRNGHKKFLALAAVRRLERVTRWKRKSQTRPKIRTTNRQLQPRTRERPSTGGLLVGGVGERESRTTRTTDLIVCAVKRRGNLPRRKRERVQIGGKQKTCASRQQLMRRIGIEKEERNLGEKRGKRCILPTNHMLPEQSTMQMPNRMEKPKRKRNEDIEEPIRTERTVYSQMSGSRLHQASTTEITWEGRAGRRRIPKKRSRPVRTGKSGE